MKFIDEKEETVHKMSFDITEEERNFLLNYGMDNISTEEMDEILLEWACLDIIKKSVYNTLKCQGEADCGDCNEGC